MKKIYAFSILLLGFIGANAQNEPKGFHLDKRINMAAILAKKPSTAIGFSSVSEARSIINDIMEVSDIQQNFRVESTTQVDNAAAVIYQGVRYILYNPSFIDQLDNMARDKWASISVLGHEIGHHLLGHTLDGRGSQLPKELEADEYSGLVLRRMGASLQQAQLAMKLIASPYASATHPGESDRLAAIARGWNSTTARSDRGNTDVTIATPEDRRTYPDPNTQGYPRTSRRNYPQVDPRSNYPDEDSRNYPGNSRTGRSGGRNNEGMMGRRNQTDQLQIVYDIRFNGNMSQQYYITAQNQVIMLRGNRARVVANITRTNNPNFPYVIFDDNQQLLVDRRGNIYPENGRRSIGYIVSHS